MEEERRLAFVAVTRAEKRLYLSEAQGRGIDGAPRYLSRFLLDIGEERMEQEPKPQEGLIEDARSYIEMRQKHLPESLPEGEFSVGDRVRHSVLGVGTVIAVDTEKGAHVVQFDNVKTPRSIAFKVKLTVE
jgi:DNA helicase-2/ATP-dependent DNA helicase PcrA